MAMRLILTNSGLFCLFIHKPRWFLYSDIFVLHAASVILNNLWHSPFLRKQCIFALLFFYLSNHRATLQIVSFVFLCFVYYIIYVSEVKIAESDLLNRTFITHSHLFSNSSN